MSGSRHACRSAEEVTIDIRSTTRIDELWTEIMSPSTAEPPAEAQEGKDVWGRCPHRQWRTALVRWVDETRFDVAQYILTYNFG